MALIPGLITFFVVIHSDNGDTEQKNSRTHIILGIFSVLNSKHILLDQYLDRNLADEPSAEAALLVTKVINPNCNLVNPASSSSSHLASWETMRIVH